MTGMDGMAMVGTDVMATVDKDATATAGADGMDMVGTETDPADSNIVDQSVAVRRYPVRERKLPEYYKL